MIRISDRIQRIAQHVPQGARVVDVGADHGLLSIHLAQQTLATFVVASDLREGPLAAAKHNVANADLEQRVDTRLGSGLTTVQPGEVDTAVIAGMGGKTIADILAESPNVVQQLQHLVLQPMGASRLVRMYLLNHSFLISQEEVFHHQGKYYELIVAEPGDGKLNYISYTDELSHEMALEFGPYLLQQPTQDFIRFVMETKRRWQQSIDSLQRSDSEAARSRQAWATLRIDWVNRWLQRSKSKSHM